MNRDTFLDMFDLSRYVGFKYVDMFLAHDDKVFLGFCALSL